MADDKTIIGMRDRDRVAAGQDYEVRHFAEKHGITADEARALIARYGHDRAKLEAALKMMPRDA